jgi:hypothetical protein
VFVVLLGVFVTLLRLSDFDSISYSLLYKSTLHRIKRCRMKHSQCVTTDSLHSRDADSAM